MSLHMVDICSYRLSDENNDFFPEFVQRSVNLDYLSIYVVSNSIQVSASLKVP